MIFFVHLGFKVQKTRCIDHHSFKNCDFIDLTGQKGDCIDLTSNIALTNCTIVDRSPEGCIIADESLEECIVINESSEDCLIVNESSDDYIIVDGFGETNGE